MGLMNLIRSLGTLRALLMLTSLICTVAAPFANGTTYLHDWRLLPSVIAPTVMVMLLFAIPLDVCMARIFMADTSPSERARLKRAISVELIMFCALALAWTPFILKLMEVWPFD